MYPRQNNIFLRILSCDTWYPYVGFVLMFADRFCIRYLLVLGYKASEPIVCLETLSYVLVALRKMRTGLESFGFHEQLSLEAYSPPPPQGPPQHGKSMIFYRHAALAVAAAMAGWLARAGEARRRSVASRSSVCCCFCCRFSFWISAAMASISFRIVSNGKKERKRLVSLIRRLLLTSHVRSPNAARLY